jgi:perosamine synthetase
MEKNDKSIPLSEPLFGGNEIQYTSECLRTGWVSSVGSFVNRFEIEGAAYCGTRHAVAVSTGTAALHTALKVLGIGAGSEVIVPTLTFIATANAVNYLGAEPVFIDSDQYLNMDPQCLRRFLEEETETSEGTLLNKSTRRPVKAVVPVHVFGHPANMEAIVSIAREFGLAVVEDATEALGSPDTEGVYAGMRPGAIGDIGCLSFNGNKIITTGGGGMLLTNNGEWAVRARHLTTQARTDPLYCTHDEIGYNYRMTNIQAAIGVAQLEQLEQFLEARRENFRRYADGIKAVKGLSLVSEPPYARSNFWMTSLVVEDEFAMSRDEVVNALNRRKILARPVWGLLHRQKPYAHCQSYGLTNSLESYKRVLNLPSGAGLTPEDIGRVLEVLVECS